MRVLITTLMHRRFGPAIASWLKAIRFAETWLAEYRFDHVLQWGAPRVESNKPEVIITAKYQEAVDMFNAGPWDYWISIEDDMIIPESALLRLTQLMKGGADVGYGLYAWRHGSYKWSAYSEIDEDGGFSVSRDPSTASRWWGTIQDVAGVGLGCTIVRRDVLKGYTMRYGETGASCDWFFSVDANRRGLVQRCDLNLLCGHMALDPSPRIITPDLNAKDLRRIELLEVSPHGDH